MGDEMRELENIDYAGLPALNVRPGERWASVLGGLVMSVLALRERSAPAALGAAYLLFRGLSGHCYVYQALGIDPFRHGIRQWPADEPPPPSVDEGDEVTESSWESFPTSDPPSWTMGKRDNND